MSLNCAQPEYGNHVSFALILSCTFTGGLVETSVFKYKMIVTLLSRKRKHGLIEHFGEIIAQGGLSHSFQGCVAVYFCFVFILM